ncbi:MAG: hypothetical protein GY754_04580 [bacterium]|nr:hypothetical protein [bacterium]
MKKRSYRVEIVLMGAMVLAIGLTLLVNDININIRNRELKQYLAASERSDNGLDHMILVMTYDTHKKMYEKRITREKADTIEMRVKSILARNKPDKTMPVPVYGKIATPLIYLLNFFRFMTDKPKIQDSTMHMGNIYLEISYYYERNSFYNKALKVYHQAQDAERYSGETKAGILLHQGFCHSIVGNNEKARKKYLSVIKDHANENIAITASILLHYLKGFQAEIKTVLPEKDSIEKGEKLCNLLAYNKALTVLKKIHPRAGTRELARIQYIQARCLEELSQNKKALIYYEEIILNSPHSPYAGPANRRIYIMGSFAENGAWIKNLAIKNNLLLKDRSFSRLISEFDPVLAKNIMSNKMKRILKKFEEKDPVFDRTAIEQLSNLNKKIDAKINEKNKTGQKKGSYKSRFSGTIQITTRKGNIFVGSIEKETAKDLFLKTTAIGIVKIEKKNILSIKKK